MRTLLLALWCPVTTLLCHCAVVMGHARNQESGYDTFTENTRLDDPTRCLLSEGQCVESRDCKSFVYAANCLDSRVPPMLSALQNQASINHYQYHIKISCCFKCCLDYMGRMYGLQNTPYIMNTTKRDEAVYTDYFSIGSEVTEDEDIARGNIAKIKMETPKPKARPRFHAQSRQSSAVLSVSGLVRLSKQIYTNVNSFPVVGMGSISKVTTVLTNSKDTWSNLKGRRTTLLFPSAECVTREAMAMALRRSSNFGNPGVAMLYTQQLPCMIGTGKKSTVDPSAVVSNLLFIDQRIRLLPAGVRNSLLLEKALRNIFVNSSQDVETHTRLLDCTCAAQFKEGRELIKSLYNANRGGDISTEEQFTCHVKGKPVPSSGHIPVDTSDVKTERGWHTERTADGSIKVTPLRYHGQEDELYNYYANSMKYKFALSPSTMRFLSPCEWEAMSMGVIPILMFPFDITVQPEINKEENIISAWRVFKRAVEKLYADTPMYRVHSWENTLLSKAALSEKYPSLVAQFSREPYSMSKGYIYSWIDEFKKHFMSGKPSGRYFTPFHEEYNKVLPPETCAGRVKTLKSIKPPPENKSLFVPAAISNSSSVSAPLLELVVPRCCEDGFEFSWLYDFVEVMDNRIAVSIYYKCPQCLPKSLAKEWIRDVISNDSRLLKRVKKGFSVLNDGPFSAGKNGRLITQTHAFDSVYNGKEVTAYLKHILTRYDTLARQTIFLHSMPNAHISFEIFYRAIKFNLMCNNSIPFLHLNVKYKQGVWGACCGFNSTCMTSTWKYIFQGITKFGNNIEQNMVAGNLNAGTYSSAQFAVSSSTIRRHDVHFYHRMMSAINGSHDLYGCDDGTREGEWGGHRLTGQYERMWHVIFGFDPRQAQRRGDGTLPPYIRQGTASHIRDEGAV